MNDVRQKFISKMKAKIAVLEQEISRARYKKKYDLGRQQGRLDGFDESLKFFESVLEEDEIDELDN